MNTAGNKTELGVSNLIELSQILTIIGNANGIDKDTVKKFIDMHQQMNPDKKLIELKNNVRILFETLSEVLYERKMELNKSANINMQQPKYKVSDAALILKVDRATLNNWTNNRGGYIRSFDLKGLSKFILEADLKDKYKELTRRELIIDDDLRNKHQYKTDTDKLLANFKLDL
jgi:hypothetical protein